MEAFKELGLSKKVLDTLKELNFKEPTDIQKKAIPLALAGKDIIGGSATGSGKTLVFACPIIENLKSDKTVQALILTPTRELAEQVSNAIQKFAQNKNLEVCAVYGGASMVNQIKKIPCSDVIVGTPGRILDHIKRQTLKLDNVKILVLDEVDRMFDMGFHKDVETIIKECPKRRQTMLFSATISPDIDHLAKKHTQNAIEISAESYVDPKKLKQVYYDVQSHYKFSLLVHLLRKESSNLIMVFCNTRRNVDFVAANLKKNKVDAVAIHGGLTQNKRSRIMEDFHGGGVHVLVCTDVAARGLDIIGVSHVYNYDLPSVSNDYIHRIGRTARAGKEGIAISLLSSRDHENFGNIIRNDSLNIKMEELPKFDMVDVKTSFGRERFRDHGSGGGRRVVRDRQGRDSSSGPRRDSSSGPRRDSRGGQGREGRSGMSRSGARRSNSQGSRDGFRGSRGGRSSGSSRRPSRGKSYSRVRR